MYFFTNEEHEKLTRFFLPRSRETQISDDLRGWNWSHPPLEPVYDFQLSVSDIASRYCPTARDLYLRKVQRVRIPPNELMLSGALFHGILCDFITRAKKFIYVHGKDVNAVLRNLENAVEEILSEHLSNIEPIEYKSNLEEKAKIICFYELRCFAARFQEVVARHSQIGIDALVFQVLPVVVEQKIDGSRLGLSRSLSCDAFNFYEPVILDLKFGSKKDFHVLSPTGYALAMESLFEYPINICCLVYVNFNQSGLKIEKEFHLISDEHRLAFIEERDQRMRMVYEEIDPGLPEQCYEYCQFKTECRG